MTQNLDSELQQIASQTLISLGFPADHRGYEYIRYAILEAYLNPELGEYITKTLYPKIARMYTKTTAQNVARACRRAIVYACDNGNLLDLVGAYKSELYPSSADVINSIVEYIETVYKRK